MVQRRVLSDEELDGLLGSDAAEEGAHGMQLGVAVAKELSDQVLVNFGLVISDLLKDG